MAAKESSSLNPKKKGNQSWPKTGQENAEERNTSLMHHKGHTSFKNYAFLDTPFRAEHFILLWF